MGRSGFVDALVLARWQFGITTVYHFSMVPLTRGLSMMVACYHTRWHRHGDEADLRLTKFFGKLFLINFAMGVVTGIVQEFQFGIAESDYSPFRNRNAEVVHRRTETFDQQRTDGEVGRVQRSTTPPCVELQRLDLGKRGRATTRDQELEHRR